MEREYIDNTNVNLIASLKKGDEKAFTLIYDAYWKKLFAISCHILQDQCLAEGAVQDVFLSLWRNREIIQINTLESYLATAVKYSSLKLLKRNNRLSQIATELDYQDISREDQKIEAVFLQEFLNGILEKLPEKCQVVFRLSREQDMKNHEISEKLKISEKTVEAHITRAIKILRMNLNKVGFMFFLHFFL